MCGICGFALNDPGSPRSAERLARMNRMLGHRGPDGTGERLDGGVGLGHLRLSIIDVATGAQPLANEDETVWISYNGEVYNYAGLTATLRAAGHSFRTRSDTEALVHAYEEYGSRFMTRLNGMFAFALHDRTRNRVILARDHFGIKPLFYSVTKEGLFFGSEIKAVLAGMETIPSIRFDSLQEYLLFRSVAGRATFFEGVHRLPPGHLAIWEDGRLHVESFWSLPPPVTENCDLGEAAARLEGLLSDSVSAQLMSEVPLGAFCSGGLDSGLVTAYAALHSRHRLKTFSVGFEDPRWDETALARQNAERVRTDHHVVVARPATFAGALPRLIWHHDEPLSHPNSVPIYYLSRFAREQVTVALTGEGADELFGGYPRYQIARLGQALDRLPKAARAVALRIVRRLPGHRSRRLSELLPHRGLEGLAFNAQSLPTGQVVRLTGEVPERAVSERLELAARCHDPADPIASITRYELLTYLPCLLDRMDRMTMASGLEGRVPFLDVRLAEWALGLPSRHKVRGRRTKVVVRALAEQRLSRDVLRAPKSGFGIPLGDWFRNPSFAQLTERVRDPSHPAAPLFERAEVDRILRESGGGADRGDALWAIANVYLWVELFRDGIPHHAPGEVPEPELRPEIAFPAPGQEDTGLAGLLNRGRSS